jgi:hypothetical protein
MHARNATLKVSPLLVDRGCEQEIADGVTPRRTRLGWESKAQQISRCRFRVREGDETVPQITDGWDPKLLS